MGNPVLAGARVVALDAAVFPIHIADADVGLAYNLLTGPAIRAITDPPHKADDFTPSGEGLQCFAPDLYLNPYRRARANGDFLIGWVRRDRALFADNWDNGEPPLSKASEAYDVEIMSGGTVLRTLTATTLSVLYTAAMQTADLGALLTLGSSPTLRIYEKSAHLGRGPALTKTLFF